MLYKKILSSEKTQRNKILLAYFLIQGKSLEVTESQKRMRSSLMEKIAFIACKRNRIFLRFVTEDIFTAHHRFHHTAISHE